MSRILAAADEWAGVPYGHPATRHDHTVIDCSTLTAHVLDAVLPSGLSSEAWADVVIGEDGRGESGPWSPIARALRDGWGEALPDAATAPVWAGWHLAQGWAHIPARGHALLVWSDGSAGLRVLEATNARAPDGAAYGVRWRASTSRGVAPLSLEDAPRVSAEALGAAYPAGVRYARLRGEGL